MNIPLDRTLCLPNPRPSRAPLGEATAIAMGAGLSAVFFDSSAGGRDRMGAEQDGLPLPRPFIAAELALRSGGVRHVLFVPQAIGTLLSRHLVLRLGATAMAEIDPSWLQLPQGDISELAAQLSPQGLRRLLRVMLTTGASLFTGTAQAGLADTLSRLMDICAIPALAPIARTDIAGRTLLSYGVPGLSGLRPPSDAVMVSDGRLTRLKDFDCFGEGDVLHVLLPPGSLPGQILAFADTPLRLSAAHGAARRLPALAWLRARGKPCCDWLFTRIGGSTAAALERELAGGLTEPVIAIRHLSGTSLGLLHLLVLQDPSRLVYKVILECQGQWTQLTPSHGPDGTALLTGFADLPGGAGGGTCRIRILYHSGRLRTLAPAPVAPYDGAVPAGFADAWTRGADVLQPLAQARAAFRREAPPSTTQQFGPARKFGLRIVTAIGGSADLIRARAAMILAESHPTPVEVVCTMTESPLAVAARHALSQAAAIYGVAHRLVLLPGHATESERLYAALTQARDVPVLVLGADVLPQDQGWLGFWLRRLGRQAALAPALLATDGSVAATCEGADPFRGLPATHLPVSGRAARRPLAGCLALGPTGVARLLDAAPHPDPAVWISGALGGIARSETRHAFRRFGPVAVTGVFADALAETEFALFGKYCG